MATRTKKVAVQAEPAEDTFQSTEPSEDALDSQSTGAETLAIGEHASSPGQTATDGADQDHPDPAQAEQSREEKERARFRRAAALQARAKLQRDKGRKALARRISGVASISKVVTIKDGMMSSVFDRWFAQFDQFMFELERQGAMLVGDKTALVMSDSIAAMVQEMHDDVVKEHGAVVVHEESERSASTKWNMLDCIPAIKDKTVQVLTPTGLLLLETILAQDELVMAGESLRWNSLRSNEDVEAVKSRAKFQVKRVFDVAEKTHHRLGRARDEKQKKVDGANREKAPVRRAIQEASDSLLMAA